MSLMTRHVVKWGLFRDRVILQVADSGVYPTHLPNRDVYALHSPWRDATDEDLRQIEADKAYENSLNFCETRIAAGSRVKVRSNSFNSGAEGVVVFQEPAGGRVWVWRDGSGGPCYYWNHELEVLKYRKAA